jgi:hypothetical protein
MRSGNHVNARPATVAGQSVLSVEKATSFDEPGARAGPSATELDAVVPGGHLGRAGAASSSAGQWSAARQMRRRPDGPLQLLSMSLQIEN